MTSTLCGRGPDSAGFALYTQPSDHKIKLSVIGHNDANLIDLGAQLAEALKVDVETSVRHTNAIFAVPTHLTDEAIAWIDERPDQLSLIGQGHRLEMYKEAGYPTEVASAFDISELAGTHGISHTRMATESAVTADGAHPFSTAPDQCLVHNGSISNYASLRRSLTRNGIKIRTENDSEVAACIPQQRDTRRQFSW